MFAQKSLVWDLSFLINVGGDFGEKGSLLLDKINAYHKPCYQNHEDKKLTTSPPDRNLSSTSIKGIYLLYALSIPLFQVFTSFTELPCPIRS